MKTNKLHIIYGTTIAVLIASVIAGAFWARGEYDRALASSKEEYEQAKVEYDEAHARLIEEENAWQIELATAQDNYNEVVEELDAIYAERQAEQDAEEARWNSLSEEEQQAEIECNQYNEMVAYLRANNPEYAELYVKYSAYINKDIFNLTKSELMEYTDLYNRKTAIENEYKLSLVANEGGEEDV